MPKMFHVRQNFKYTSLRLTFLSLYNSAEDSLNQGCQVQKKCIHYVILALPSSLFLMQQQKKSPKNVL